MDSVIRRIVILAGPSQDEEAFSTVTRAIFIHDGSSRPTPPLDETCTDRPPRGLAVGAGYQDGFRGDGEPPRGIQGKSIMYEILVDFRRRRDAGVRRSR